MSKVPLLEVVKIVDVSKYIQTLPNSFLNLDLMFDFIRSGHRSLEMKIVLCSKILSKIIHQSKTTFQINFFRALDKKSLKCIKQNPLSWIFFFSKLNLNFCYFGSLKKPIVSEQRGNTY